MKNPTSITLEKWRLRGKIIWIAIDFSRVNLHYDWRIRPLGHVDYDRCDRIRLFCGLDPPIWRICETITQISIVIAWPRRIVWWQRRPFHFVFKRGRFLIDRHDALN